MGTILDEIVAHKRLEVERAARAVPLADVEAALTRATPPRGFARALERDGAGRTAIIAEVKKASPSRGIIRADFDPVAIARAYERGGASAVSVLTDEKYFQGRLEFLRDVRDAISLPVLRKDFIVSDYQIIEARAAGADAILLILAALSDDRELVRFARRAEDLGMDVLWEVHDRAELDRLLSLDASPRIVGVNNRNLRTFAVSLETTRSLLPAIPTAAVKVSESGFFGRAELAEMEGWGVDAFLIGESLMRASDPELALRALVRNEAAS